MKNAANDDLKSTRTARSGSVGYTTVANAMPASQGAAPYLGQTHVAGSYTQDDVANRIASSKGAHCGVEEVKLVLNAVGSYLLDRMPVDLCSFDIGFAHVRPAIGGQFPSMDSAFDAERNRIYVSATPSEEIRDALSSGTPTRIDASAAGEPMVGNVTWNNKSQTIKSGESFTVLGNALTMDVGDESAMLKLPDDGGSVRVTLTPDDPDCWQRLTGRTDSAINPCEGAVLVVRTHGYDRESSLKEISSKGITVLAGDTPAGITLTGVHAPGIESPMIHLESGIWFDGTGLDGWTGGENDEILGKNNRAEEAEWTRLDLHEDIGGEVVFDGGMLKMDEGAWTLLENLGIVEGSEVRFQVKIAGQTAEIVATVAEA